MFVSLSLHFLVVISLSLYVFIHVFTPLSASLHPYIVVPCWWCVMSNMLYGIFMIISLSLSPTLYLYVCVFISSSLCRYISISLCLYPRLYTFIRISSSLYSSTMLVVCYVQYAVWYLHDYLFIFISYPLSLCLSLYLFISLSLYLYLFMSLSTSVHLYLHLFILI